MSEHKPIENEPQPIQSTDTVTPSATKKSKKAPIIIGIVVVFIIVWMLVRPGIFTIQPIGAMPEGITIVYHSRNPEMSFFSSPDSMCLEMQGSVSLLCRGMAISASDELADRIILRLPYSHWAYLRSTGGMEFEN